MFDTEKISYISWRDAAARYGYQIDDEVFRKTVGTNLISTKDIYLKHFGGSQAAGHLLRRAASLPLLSNIIPVNILRHFFKPFSFQH